MTQAQAIGCPGTELLLVARMGCFSSKPAPLKEETRAVLKDLFAKMDKDSNGQITKKEAADFWGKNFAKVNAKAFFKEVDTDASETITEAEFLSFWEQVKQSGYKEAEILEEVKNMSEDGKSWRDWNDGRKTD
uniref:EF-hand domain-containing protein n=1 Tax=Pyrodinium bahamense TaxID=73915 RepID=A0A7R9ZWV8_9DINO